RELQLFAKPTTPPLPPTHLERAQGAVAGWALAKAGGAGSRAGVTFLTVLIQCFFAVQSNVELRGGTLLRRPA
ncbi:MAG: hypothetical protein WHU54_09695, partial [Candidatus Bathyarchaeia archaeon]